MKLLLVLALLGVGAWLPAQEKDPLYWAVFNNDAPQVWALTQNPAAASSNLKTGVPPLVLAVGRGWFDTASVLLERGASAQVSDDKNTPVVILAARQGRVDLVRLLLSKGASPDSVDSNKRGLWHEAAIQPSGRLGTFLAGLNLSANVYDATGQSPLHLAAQSERLDNARLLLQKGADPKQKNHQGLLPSDLSPKTAEWDALWR